MSKIHYIHGSFLSYVGRLAKEDFEVENVLYKHPHRVVISPCFFRDYSCECCGKCCKKIDTMLFWTDYELKKNPLGGDFPISQTHDEKIVIKDPVTLSTRIMNVRMSNWNVKDKCPMLKDDVLCSIHSTKPIQCQLTPLHVDVSKRYQTSRLTKRKFMRNWKFGCPMKFHGRSNPSVLQRDIEKLNVLNEIAIRWGIKTWLPEIITDYLLPCIDENHSIWTMKDIPTIEVYNEYTNTQRII